MELQRNKRATFEGIVVADTNDKTITVLVETYKRHKLYGKRVKYRKKYYAHDENNVANVGDKVLISGARPMSKTKRWRLVKVLQLAEVSIEDFQEALEEEAAAVEEATVEEAVVEKIEAVVEETPEVVEAPVVDEKPAAKKAEPKAEAKPAAKKAPAKKALKDEEDTA